MDAAPGQSPGSDGVELEPDVEELWSSRALLLVLILLIFSLYAAYYLKIRRIKSVHETLVALLAGASVGLLIRLSPGVVVQGMLSFKHTILLNVLLPPIILNSGFELRQENFFRNFAVILAFAFAGTFISACVLGVLVYIWALLGLEGLSLSIIECLQFGSTLSATDPVTILAIFNQLKVDPKLYAIIFGESLLNDAVAIVMFETLSQFHGEQIHFWSFFHGVGIFFLVFFISMALGVIFGLACSLLLKHSSLAHFSQIECCLIMLIAYTSYFFSNALSMSGIVSLLFCGITLKHYAYHNMSRRTQRATKYMFATLAQLCENFIFIYLGLSLFTQTQLVYKPIFILVTGLGVCVARYCAVFPISKVINFLARSRGAQSPELPHSYQMMLFWAGLRGAVGVALAAGLKGDNGAALRTTVLMTVVLTMLVFGGTTVRMIDIVGIRIGVEDEDESSDEEDYAPPGRPQWHDGKYLLKAEEHDIGMAPSDAPYRDRSIRSQSDPYSQDPSYRSSQNMARNFSSASLASEESFESEVLPSASPMDAADGLSATAVWRDGQWFNVLDERYLLPVFSNATASRKQASRKAALKKNRSSFNVDRVPPDAVDSTHPSPSFPEDSRLANWASTSRQDPEISFQTVLTSLMSPAPTVPPSPTIAPGHGAKKWGSGSGPFETHSGSSTPDLNPTGRNPVFASHPDVFGNTGSRRSFGRGDSDRS